MRQNNLLLILLFLVEDKNQFSHQELIYLVLLAKNLIDVLKSVTVTLTKTNDLVDECKGQIRKLDKPLGTINDLSETVDNVHESAKAAVNTAINAIIANLENVKHWIQNIKNKGNEVVVEEEDTPLS